MFLLLLLNVLCIFANSKAGGIIGGAKATGLNQAFPSSFNSIQSARGRREKEERENEGERW